jgi:hypothetical protein
MKRISLLFACISVCFFSCTDDDSEPNDNQPPSEVGLYIVQGIDESLAHINLETSAVDPQAVPLGSIPNDIISRHGLLYVTNSGFNTIQEIDPDSLSTIREIEVPEGIYIWSMAFLNDDSLAITGSVSQNLIVLRLSDEQVVADIEAGVGPQGIIVHGNRIFVTVTAFNGSGFDPGAVFVYDRNTLQRTDSLHVGINPQNAAIDNQGRLHVVCTGNYADVAGSIHIINTTTLETEDSLGIGGTPTNVSFSDDYAFVAAGGWDTQGYVYRYDLNTLAILNDSSNPIATGIGAFDVEARENGEFFVSCFDADVVELRSADGTLLDSYPVSDGPGQMVIHQ